MPGEGRVGGCCCCRRGEGVVEGKVVEVVGGGGEVEVGVDVAVVEDWQC